MLNGRGWPRLLAASHGFQFDELPPMRDFGADEEKELLVDENESRLSTRADRVAALVDRQRDPSYFEDASRATFHADLKAVELEDVVEFGPQSAKLIAMLAGEVAVSPQEPQWWEDFMLLLVSLAVVEKSLYGIYCDGKSGTAQRAARMLRTGAFTTKFGPAADSVLGQIFTLVQQYAPVLGLRA